MILRGRVGDALLRSPLQKGEPLARGNLLSLLACPRDEGPLEAKPATDEERTGADGDCEEALVCASCGARWPVEDGIVRCLGSSANPALDRPEKLDEMRARDREASTFEARYTGLRNAIEVPPCLGALDARAEDAVVELGCGTGRFTLLYAGKVSATVAIDFSLASLRELSARLAGHERDRVVLVHGDVCHPAARAGAFSKVASFQVLEHIPTSEQRAAAFATARRLLGPEGRFVCSVYHWSRSKKRRAANGKADNAKKEGLHRSTPPIYYYNFEETELRSLLERAGFRLERLEGIDLELPGLRLWRRLAVALNRRLAATGFGIANAHLLLSSASARR